MRQNHTGHVLDLSSYRPVPESKLPTKMSANLPSTDFLWVDSYGQKPKGQSLSGAKQTFLKTKHHRRRREAQLQKLRTSIVPFPAPSPPVEENALALQTRDASPHWVDQHAREPVLYSGLEMGLKQCFPSLGVNTRLDLDLYFHYYINFTSKTCFPMSFTSVTIWLWQKALAQPEFIPVILAGSATHRAANLWLAGAPPQMILDSDQDSLRLRSQAIKYLQRMLDNPDDPIPESTVLFVTQLLGTEQIEANVEAADVHFNGLMRLIDKAGGLDTLEDHTLSIIYSNDALKALTRNSKPSFTMSHKWEQKIYRDLASLKKHLRSKHTPHLASRLFNAPFYQDLNPELRCLVDVLRQVVPCYEGVIDLDDGTTPIGHSCICLLAHRLLGLADECTGNHIEDTLRLSLLLYCVVRIWTFQGLPCMQSICMGLQKTISYGYATLMAEAPDFLLWALFMGSLGSQNHECHSWFLNNLVDVAEYLGVTDWNKGLAMLEDFFFVYRSIDEPARLIWNSAIQSRSCVYVL